MLACVPSAPVYADEAFSCLSDEVPYLEAVTPLKLLSSGRLLLSTRHGTRGYGRSNDFCPHPAPHRVLFSAVSRADVLKAPAADAESIFRLPRFSGIEVCGREGIYHRVRLLSGEEGFVHPAHLFSPPPPSPDAVVSTALSLLGVPYRWGGRSDLGVDCSGLVCLAFGLHGVLLPRDTGAMHALPEVPRENARRGDLVLFSSHVALLLTPTRFLHASAAAGCVTVGSLSGRDPLFDAPHVSAGYVIKRIL